MSECSSYRSGVAQRVGKGIALLFHDRGTRRGWVVSSTPRPHFTPGKDPVPIVQEAGWGPGPVWTGGISRPCRDSIPDRPARSQSLYRLSYRAHPPPLGYMNNSSPGFRIRSLPPHPHLLSSSARIITPASARKPKERRTGRQLPTLYGKYCSLPKQQDAHINVTVSSNP